MSETGTLERQRNVRLTAAEDDALLRIAYEDGSNNVSAVIRRLIRRALFLAPEVSNAHVASVTLTSAEQARGDTEAGESGGNITDAEASYNATEATS